MKTTIWVSIGSAITWNIVDLLWHSGAIWRQRSGSALAQPLPETLLIYYGIVTPYEDSDLGQHWLSHYLKHCWFIITYWRHMKTAIWVSIGSAITWNIVDLLWHSDAIWRQRSGSALAQPLPETLLIYYGIVAPYEDSDLGQHWLSHYLKHCWFIMA